MKKYVVIYMITYTKTLVKYVPRGWASEKPYTDESFHTLSTKEFDDYQLAYEFATKNGGYVLQPVLPKPLEPQENSNE